MERFVVRKNDFAPCLSEWWIIVDTKDGYGYRYRHPDSKKWAAYPTKDIAEKICKELNDLPDL
jgi:hypothetical protein